MKTIQFRLTDKQYHYLASLARSEKRSVEHMLWMIIPEGVDMFFSERPYDLEKLQCDFNEADMKKLEGYPVKPSWGGEYYGTHHWAEEIAGNVLADIDGTLEAADAAFDLQAEVDATAALYAQRKADHEAKEAAMKQAAE